MSSSEIDGCYHPIPFPIPIGFTEIVAVRHGETACNASRIIQGHLDSELNETGRKQAYVVGVRLSKEPKFSAIYSSDLKRASETAEIIANLCGLPEGGGESHNQLYLRCTSALERIAAKHIGERVLVVSHGGTLRELYRRACQKGPDGKLQNTAVSKYQISVNKNKWILRSWGDVSHLQDVEILEDGFGGDKNSA